MLLQGLFNTLKKELQPYHVDYHRFGTQLKGNCKNMDWVLYMLPNHSFIFLTGETH